MTRREARSAEWTRVRYDLVERDGLPTARVTTRLPRVLPHRPDRYAQAVAAYFDEELKVVTSLGTGRTRLRAGFGGPVDQGPGCRGRLDGLVGKNRVVQWVPTRCLDNPYSEMVLESRVGSTQEPRRRYVGLDTHRPSRLIRWK